MDAGAVDEAAMKVIHRGHATCETEGIVYALLGAATEIRAYLGTMPPEAADAEVSDAVRAYLELARLNVLSAIRTDWSKVSGV